MNEGDDHENFNQVLDYGDEIFCLISCIETPLPSVPSLDGRFSDCLVGTLTSFHPLFFFFLLQQNRPSEMS